MALVTNQIIGRGAQNLKIFLSVVGKFNYLHWNPVMCAEHIKETTWTCLSMQVMMSHF
jgi:hypothetical protein